MSSIGDSTSSTISKTTVYGELARELVIAGGTFVQAKHQAHVLQPENVRTLGRAGHTGAPAHALDVDADEFMREALRQLEPEAIYKSEESDSGANLVPDRILFHCDPIDGTRLLRALGTGWAVVGFFEKVRRDGKSVAHLGGAIYVSDGTVVSWARTRHEGYVRIDFPPLPLHSTTATTSIPWAEQLVAEARKPRTVILERDDDDGAPILLRAGESRYVASVAASPARRSKVFELYDLPDTNLWTLGGNPVVAALLLHELGGVIEVDSIELRDGAFLVPLKIVGGHIEGVDGSPIDIMSIFESTDADRQLPPFVASADRDVARQIRALRRLESAA